MATNADPFKHLRDFERLWLKSDYCPELQDYGNLDDEVYVAEVMGQSEPEIRAWVLDRLKRLATAEESG